MKTAMIARKFKSKILSGMLEFKFSKFYLSLKIDILRIKLFIPRYANYVSFIYFLNLIFCF